MLNIRKSAQRGHANHGWLETYHSFSFADYYDPKHMGVSHLRVINDDRIAPGAGFPTHPHRDMEIVTYILDGVLAHRDSMGNGTTIHSGEVQRMSAGTGITHSEYNASETEPVHLLQIWIMPNQQGLTPSYEQTLFTPEEKQARLRLIASPDGREGSVTIHQDALMYASLLANGDSVQYAVQENRIAYLHVARGSVKLNGAILTTGDGATVHAENISVAGVGSDSEFLLFDLIAQITH